MLSKVKKHGATFQNYISLDLQNSATKWPISLECFSLFLVFYMSLQPKKRVYNSSSQIIVPVTSIATGVNVVAAVNICTIVCLPLIRIRMRNDYAWTPVFDKNKSNKIKRNKIQYFLFGPTLVYHCVRFGKQNKIHHPGRMGNMKSSPQPQALAAGWFTFEDTTLMLILWFIDWVGEEGWKICLNVRAEHSQVQASWWRVKFSLILSDKAQPIMLVFVWYWRGCLCLRICPQFRTTQENKVIFIGKF